MDALEIADEREENVRLTARRARLAGVEVGTNQVAVEALTIREAQVLSWAARGRQNREIAELLYISPATVRKHLEHAYAKLGVRSRTEAVAALRGSMTGIFPSREPGVEPADRPPRRVPG